MLQKRKNISIAGLYVCPNSIFWVTGALYCACFTYDKAAQIAVICAGTGNKVYELSCEDVDVMHDFYEKHYSKRQQGEE